MAMKLKSRLSGSTRRRFEGNVAVQSASDIAELEQKFPNRRHGPDLNLLSCLRPESTSHRTVVGILVLSVLKLQIKARCRKFG
jgi:hypothetical protein